MKSNCLSQTIYTYIISTQHIHRSHTHIHTHTHTAELHERKTSAESNLIAAKNTEVQLIKSSVKVCVSVYVCVYVRV
jgi:hypothetical protein